MAQRSSIARGCSAGRRPALQFADRGMLVLWSLKLSEAVIGHWQSFMTAVFLTGSVTVGGSAFVISLFAKSVHNHDGVGHRFWKGRLPK